jgi:peptidoglycan/xylan/chitin deacetylase (PgdA/CDA1 family)
MLHVLVVLSKCGAGAIILLHDGLELKPDADRRETVRALPVILSQLKARGYRFVTVPELINSPRPDGPTAPAHVTTVQTPVQ